MTEAGAAVSGRRSSSRGIHSALMSGMKHIIDSNHRGNGRARRIASIFGAVAAALVAVATTAYPQRAPREPESLRGSKASVEKMYDFALSRRYPFYLTPFTLDQAIAQGKLVPLTGDATYELTRGVGFSYSTVEVREFITQFAPQYLAACGAPLTVTSAARPLSRQPHNANPHSVHPTGIAVDIRRPYPGPCLTWVRNALADLEAQGIVEATEEHHPVHLHIAVLKAPGERFKLPDLTNGVVVAREAQARTTILVSAPPNGVAGMPATVADSLRAEGLYRVRPGDTLWDVAQKTGVSVEALAAANPRTRTSVLRAGSTLKLPVPSEK
jgi:LysM repeat protein